MQALSHTRRDPHMTSALFDREPYIAHTGRRTVNSLKSAGDIQVIPIWPVDWSSGRWVLGHLVATIKWLRTKDRHPTLLSIE